MDSRQRDDYAEAICGKTQNRLCEWCASPFHKVYKAGLCSHCYGIRNKRAKLDQQISILQEHGRAVPYPLHYNREVACEMATLAKNESISFRGDDSAHTGMRIEHLMMYISKHLVGKNYFSNYASIFDHLFTPSQRRAVLYLLSEPAREHMRRNRGKYAVDRLAERGVYPLPPPPLRSKSPHTH
jgi:hypothetical protein